MVLRARAPHPDVFAPRQPRELKGARIWEAQRIAPIGPIGIERPLRFVNANVFAHRLATVERTADRRTLRF